MNTLVSSAASTTSLTVQRARNAELRVLTLSPFYPSALDWSQGRFVSDPLERIGEHGIANETIAVQPFYRARPKSAAGREWTSYFSVPGNVGLPSAGEFLAASISRKIIKDRAGRFDLIHAHAALPCGHAAAILADRLGVPFVVTVHGLDAFFLRQSDAVFRSWCRRVARRVYQRAEVVICISEKVREQVLSGAQANTRVVYNGVDPQLFSPLDESDLPLKVLSVGNLIPTKGHAALLRSFAKASQAVSDSRLEIIGDGPELRHLVRLASDLGIADKVAFRGRQTREFVADAMRRCSVFALPSTYEGLGCVYLEAMACGKAVIACRGQGIEELIEDRRTGILVSAGNDFELGNALRELLLKPQLRREIGKAARNFVLQRLTLDHQAKQLADIYRGCTA